MAWRLAKSLETLRKQVNEAAPKRSKASDGTIGDAKHATTSSDHNPHVKDGATGIVTAIDITHDPKSGVDSQKLAEALVAFRDPRIKYIISNKMICSSTTSPWQWRKYTGSNPHNHHVHISVKPDKKSYDNTDPWKLNTLTPAPSAPAVSIDPILRKGSKGADVKRLQKLLGIPQGGAFGTATFKAVTEFQKVHGLIPDGVVGQYTWNELTKPKAMTPLGMMDSGKTAAQFVEEREMVTNSPQIGDQVKVEVKSAVASKINWVQGLGLLAGIGSFFGLKVTPETLAAVEVTIGGVTQVVTWIMRTWFTKSVIAASVAK